MNRYFYYFTFVNMITNIITTVPMILLGARMKGAIFSILLAIVAGLFIMYFFVNFFNDFPGEGLPELLKRYLSKWISTPLLIYLAFTWLVGGLIPFITYTFLIKRFLTPEMPLPLIATSFLLFISFGVLMKPTSVLYTIEIVFLLVTPLILLLLLKAYGSKDLEWDFVRESIMYIWHMPNYAAFSAAIYIFLGSANLIIFNRLFTNKQTFAGKQLLIIGLAGFFILITTYFIPIGYNGFEHIDEIVYPWNMTSDSLRMPYGIVERVLYMFLLFFLAITFLSMLMIWHVTIEVFKSIIWFERFKWKGHNLTPFLFILFLWAVSLKVVTYLNEYELVKMTSYFFNGLPISFLMMLLVFKWIKRRALS
ncbi:GerAB/ArcD/ProY family transporter [Bacillus sp. FJAT-50079]|uniref:GerAB/ArcD/ProY family transporter n=1 Tax=Bacillus sp. FJAT-50079 TaxID=2833577 RepID=UPI001BC9166D|nr:GerAB/ArcD/ProY family transporter [Bacillus sp. FJAT-50079]MBS4210241.1 GerAB/ArcD/ProY family transporter [Bacillus sp. FJAT-50079]